MCTYANGGPLNLPPRVQRGTQVTIGALPFAAGKEARPLRRRRQFALPCLADLFLEPGAAADRLHGDRLDHQILAAVDKAELRLMRTFERGFHFYERGERLPALLIRRGHKASG